MPGQDGKRAAFRALEERVRNGPGDADARERARAFGNEGLDVPLDAPLDALIGKVAASPALVTDADFAAARASGLSDDQLFELVVCAAVGQSARLYDAGLAALAAATDGADAANSGDAPGAGEAGNAS